MVLIRNSPSGPDVDVGGGGDVASVFGRTGDVVAAPGDYGSTDITNQSSVPGVTVTDALDALDTRVLTSSDVQNDSSVPGSSVSDALDYLLAASGGSSTNSLVETFAGGSATSTTTSNTNANIGDKGWNYLISGTATGNSCAKIAGETGALGIYRVTSPSTLFAFASLYLGSPTLGIFSADGWQRCTFRARVDSVQGSNEIIFLGVTSAVANLPGTGESAAFISQLAGAGASPNFSTRTSHNSGGNTAKDTGVPVDGLFHDFEIVRVDANQIDFYIDGVLRTTHSTALGNGIPTGPMIPEFVAVGGGATTFVDADAFTFEPV